MSSNGVVGTKGSGLYTPGEQWEESPTEKRETGNKLFYAPVKLLVRKLAVTQTVLSLIPSLSAEFESGYF